jgi:hypothetical protein
VNESRSLARDECVALLADQCVGRLAVVLNGVPDIFPVNYVLDGDAVVFKTNAGRKLEGITRGVVAFEVDMVDHASRSGWSVVVRGVGEEVTPVDRPDVVERLLGLPLGVWAAGDKPHLVRLPADQVTGRQVGPALGTALHATKFPETATHR